MVQIIPAILATNEQEYQEKLNEIVSSGAFEDGWVQIDLMDNKFVQNASISPQIISKYPTNLKLETQLMVEYPESWIDELVKAKVGRIVFPVEDDAGILERINHIKNHQIEVGLSINPETVIEKITPFVGTIDLVLVMSVAPGFGGQQFILKSIDKVRQIKSQGWPIKIGVDGGINEAVVKDLVEAGADYLVIGSHLVEGDIDENLERIWEKIKA